MKYVKSIRKLINDKCVTKLSATIQNEGKFYQYISSGNWKCLRRGKYIYLSYYLTLFMNDDVDQEICQQTKCSSKEIFMKYRRKSQKNKQMQNRDRIQSYKCCVKYISTNILGKHTIVNTAVMVHNLNVSVPKTKHFYNHNKQNKSQDLKLCMLSVIFYSRELSYSG